MSESPSSSDLSSVKPARDFVKGRRQIAVDLLRAANAVARARWAVGPRSMTAKDYVQFRREHGDLLADLATHADLLPLILRELAVLLDPMAVTEASEDPVLSIDRDSATAAIQDCVGALSDSVARLLHAPPDANPARLRAIHRSVEATARLLREQLTEFVTNHLSVGNPAGDPDV